MREKKTFAQRTRTRNTDEVRKKYFLVYEGKETEEIYFEGVNQNRSMIGINPLIELVPVVRSYSEEGWSNPKKIVDRMLLNLKESRLGTVSYETEYSCAVTPQVRQTGNRLSGPAGTAYASLLT